MLPPRLMSFHKSTTSVSHLQSMHGVRSVLEAAKVSAQFLAQPLLAAFIDTAGCVKA